MQGHLRAVSGESRPICCHSFHALSFCLSNFCSHSEHPYTFKVCYPRVKQKKSVIAYYNNKRTTQVWPDLNMKERDTGSGQTKQFVEIHAARGYER